MLNQTIPTMAGFAGKTIPGTLIEWQYCLSNSARNTTAMSHIAEQNNTKNGTTMTGTAF